MFLQILVNVIGLFTIASNNALYPTYENCYLFRYSQQTNGPSFEDVNNNLFYAKMETEITSNVYFNSYRSENDNEYHYRIDNINYSITLNYYYLESDGSYTDTEIEYTFTHNLGTTYFTQSNIDTFNFSLELEYSDIFEVTFRNPNAEHIRDQVITDSTAISEARYYTNFKYVYSFSGQFKQMLSSLINQSGDANQMYNQGYNTGYGNGYDDAYNDGYGAGYNQGTADGWEEASQVDTTAVTIFSGILSVGLLPVNFFLAILNFEVFGINIGAFVSALLTVAIIVIVTRMVVNGGNGKD